MPLQTAFYSEFEVILRNTSNNCDNNMSTSYFSNFYLSKEQLEKFKSDKIINIRIIATANSVTFDIAEKNALNVQLMAKCMLL